MSDESNEQAGPPAPQPAAGGSARYTGSPSGVIGAMLLIVVLVLGIVVVRSLFRADLDQGDPDPIDYLDTVLVLQNSGQSVVYPASLPAGWYATQIELPPDDRPTFRLNLYTDDDKFVGIRQRDESADDLLEDNASGNLQESDPLTGVGDVSATWDGWTADGGDNAYTTAVGDQTVAVYGDVSAADLAELVGLLTLDPLPTATPSAASSATSSASPSPASTP